ncbi:hypothetical protein K435DRAFT_875836 [Dendrothele bispora CBS 962.96]|uniref:Uncharacterized protein n=1 Tax=Dendrothele bispora (strain CBS 962.96) TaxID=1314807 RepID=A0A4S8KTH7_DENBC|nr:hypothetical protein K435DRAFT_875836 [Dendrothele bispora CBS 962.96]
MDALTTNLQNLQPSLNLSSRLDNTQSEVTSTINYTPVVLVALLFAAVLFILRLRYPCLTLSELGKFVDELRVTQYRNALQRGNEEILWIVLAGTSLQRQIDGIEYEWSRRAIFRWSSVYGYLRASLIAVRNIAKCYDQAQALRVSVLDVIARERRIREDIENQYHLTINSEENRRHDTNADADTGSFGWITSLLQGITRIPGQGDQ